MRELPWILAILLQLPLPSVISVIIRKNVAVWARTDVRLSGGTAIGNRKPGNS